MIYFTMSQVTVLYYCGVCKDGKERTSLFIEKGDASMLLDCGHYYIPDEQDKSRCLLHGFLSEPTEGKGCPTCSALGKEHLDELREFIKELDLTPRQWRLLDKIFEKY